MKACCTFLEVDGDIPYLIPDKIPDEEAVQEGKNNLIKHLESLIQKLKVDHGESDNVDNPKAMAGEDSGEDLFVPSDEEPEEPHIGKKGVPKMKTRNHHQDMSLVIGKIGKDLLKLMLIMENHDMLNLLH